MNDDDDKPVSAFAVRHPPVFIDVTDAEIESIRGTVREMTAGRGGHVTVSRVVAAIRLKIDYLRDKSDEELRAVVEQVPDVAVVPPVGGGGGAHRVTELESVRTARRAFLDRMLAIGTTADRQRVVYVAYTWLETPRSARDRAERTAGQHSLRSAYAPPGPDGRSLVYGAEAAYTASPYSYPLLADTLRRTRFPDDEEMTRASFLSWFQRWFKRLCALLPAPAVIVMDTAPLHCEPIFEGADARVTRATVRCTMDRVAATLGGHELVWMPEFHSVYNPLQRIMAGAKLNALRGDGRADLGGGGDLFAATTAEVQRHVCEYTEWDNMVNEAWLAYEVDRAAMG